MECYEGATMIKTYRGSLLNNEEHKINLKTNRGEIGYRINKLEIMPGAFAAADQVAILKIHKLSTAAIATVDFSDSDILAAGVLRIGNLISETMTSIVIFDR